LKESKLRKNDMLFFLRWNLPEKNYESSRQSEDIYSYKGRTDRAPPEE
jgi:hypothetical protein